MIFKIFHEEMYAQEAERKREVDGIAETSSANSATVQTGTVRLAFLKRFTASKTSRLAATTVERKSVSRPTVAVVSLDAVEADCRAVRALLNRPRDAGVRRR